MGGKVNDDSCWTTKTLSSGVSCHTRWGAFMSMTGLLLV